MLVVGDTFVVTLVPQPASRFALRSRWVSGYRTRVLRAFRVHGELARVVSPYAELGRGDDLVFGVAHYLRVWRPCSRGETTTWSTEGKRIDAVSGGLDLDTKCVTAAWLPKSSERFSSERARGGGAR